MTRACTSSWAPSVTRRLRNNAKKTERKPCAGKPHARIERRMGKQTGNGTAPLTTNEPVMNNQRQHPATHRGNASTSPCRYRDCPDAV